MDSMDLQTSESVTKLLQTLPVDTVARYPLFNLGKPEQLLGDVLHKWPEISIIDTKVYPEVDDGNGDLTRAAM